jgi:hypothetical protein
MPGKIIQTKSARRGGHLDGLRQVGSKFGRGHAKLRELMTPKSQTTVRAYKQKYSEKV